MLVVHGFWRDEQGLCLWAEDSERTVKSPSQALRLSRPHPFAGPAEQLVELAPGKPGTATLLLPSLRSAPLDSPDLIRAVPRPAPTKDPTLLAWSVPVVVFEPAAALVALDEPAEDVRYGTSMRFLSGLAAFAHDLAERGRVLPVLDRDATGYAARWRPLVQGPEVVAMRGWVAAMPPVCRAETDTPSDMRGRNPTESVSSMVEALVDASVRRHLADADTSPVGGLPARRGRPSKRTPVVELW